MDFDLRQLETFCRVVELRSFTGASTALGISQATVSERIASLERTVGTKLLDRLRREVVPTTVGQRLYARGQRLVAEKHDLIVELEGLLGVERGHVLLGASTIPGEYVVPGCVARFQRQHGKVSVSVRIADTATIRAAVADGDVELGVVGSQSDAGGLRHEALWHDELVLAVPATHRWARRRKVRLAELADEPFVMREAGSATREIMERALGAAGEDRPSLRVVAELGSTTAVKEGILEGLGVSILSSRAVASDVRAGRIKTMRVADLDLARRFFLVYDPRRSRSPICTALMRFLRADAST